MKYYFCGRYSAAELLATRRDELRAAVRDAIVVSSWLDHHGGALATSVTPDDLAADSAMLWPSYGAKNIAEMTSAHCCVAFTTWAGGGKGGRHHELGFMLGLGKRVALVGPREHLFHADPRIEMYPTWSTFVDREILLASRRMERALEARDRPAWARDNSQQVN